VFHGIVRKPPIHMMSSPVWNNSCAIFCCSSTSFVLTYFTTSELATSITAVTAFCTWFWKCSVEFTCEIPDNAVTLTHSTLSHNGGVFVCCVVRQLASDGYGVPVKPSIWQRRIFQLFTCHSLCSDLYSV